MDSYALTWMHMHLYGCICAYIDAYAPSRGNMQEREFVAAYAF